MSKKLAVIFSDWHLHAYKQFNTNGDRLDWGIKVLRDLGVFCANHKIEYILFSGDLFDKQQHLPTEVVNEVIDMFKQFFSTYPDIKFIAISGNHDHASKNTMANPAITALTHLGTVFEHFILIDNSNYTLEDTDVTIHGIPYYEYESDYSKALDNTIDSLDSDSTNYLLIHQTPNGLGNEMIATDTNPADPRYKEFEHTYCGHIHVYKRITETFTLVGNPHQRDSADEGQKKGFLVCNLLAPENGHKFIELKGYPKFITVSEDDHVEDDFNYLIVEPSAVDQSLSIASTEGDFTPTTNPVDLLEAYCKEVFPDDLDLLKVGLSFIPKTQVK